MMCFQENAGNVYCKQIAASVPVCEYDVHRIQSIDKGNIKMNVYRVKDDTVNHVRWKSKSSREVQKKNIVVI